MGVGMQMAFVVASGQAAALMAVLPSQEEFRLPRTMQGAVGNVGMPELFWRGFRLSFGCLHLQSTHRVFSCARGPWVPLHKPSPQRGG